jgi:hypothetical protein
MAVFRIFRRNTDLRRPSTISKPYSVDFGNPSFTIRVESTVRRARKSREHQVFRGWPARLSVRLIPL